MNHEVQNLPERGGAGGGSKRTFWIVGRVLDDLLVALELGGDDLVPGDPQLVVDVDGMLRLLRLVDLHLLLTADDKHLDGRRRRRRNSGKSGKTTSRPVCDTSAREKIPFFVPWRGCTAAAMAAGGSSRRRSSWLRP